MLFLSDVCMISIKCEICYIIFLILNIFTLYHVLSVELPKIVFLFLRVTSNSCSKCEGFGIWKKDDVLSIRPALYTPRKTYMTLENHPFEDVSPTENGDFPLPC